MLIRAARYLNCKPWELDEMPQDWVEWSMTCESSDIEVENAAAAGESIAARHERIRAEAYGGAR